MQTTITMRQHKQIGIKAMIVDQCDFQLCALQNGVLNAFFPMPVSLA